MIICIYCIYIYIYIHVYAYENIDTYIYCIEVVMVWGVETCIVQKTPCFQNSAWPNDM